MEESNLLKERLQAITVKHRIQEDIRQKKLELDQEKLKLQHIKKKALREQWLLPDSASNNAADSMQQQTRALQLSIHRIEMEVESLEREESMISTNESFILNRLKAVEKSTEDIIKEAQDSFVPEPLQVTRVVPDVPECLSPPANQDSEPTTPRKTLFAMEINVTKNMLTGESTVLSTANVLPEELKHTGLKVYDDGRKCVYAVGSQEGSTDESCVSELSATEVEQLLRSATVHNQVKHQNLCQNPSRREEHCFYSHQEERDTVEGHDLRNQGGHYGHHVLKHNIAEKDFNGREKWLDEHRYHYSRQECRNNHSNLRQSHHLGHHYGNQQDDHHSSYQVRNCHSVQGGGPVSHHSNGIIRSSSWINGSRPNGYPPPRSHDQRGVSFYQPQLCYTPANYIPLADYISVDEQEHSYKTPSYQSNSQTENSHNQSTALYHGPSHTDRVPSPLYGDDTPYTILNIMETTEPITAIFMGYQTAQDDSGQVQEFEGSLKAELVIIEDNEDNCEDSSTKEKKNHTPARGSANGNMRQVEGDRCTERQVGPGIKKIQKKHKACCTVC
ncbi:palmdelphin-like [Parambassis ranga]|uniref:Palmdelphin n=1 Tax=Parambassis ranga TaxID=210632 RepID=A0A6P7K8Q1_9TELE|nr:palmdelphin-like [Parambassis ranga]